MAPTRAALRAENQRDIDHEQQEMHCPLQHVGARAAEGQRAHEQREDEERGIDSVEP